MLLPDCSACPYHSCESRHLSHMQSVAGDHFQGIHLSKKLEYHKSPQKNKNYLNTWFQGMSINSVYPQQKVSICQGIHYNITYLFNCIVARILLRGFTHGKYTAFGKEGVFFPVCDFRVQMTENIFQSFFCFRLRSKGRGEKNRDADEKTKNTSTSGILHNSYN